MKDIFDNYFKSISSKFSHEETSEMGYRTDFEILFKGIFETINVKRIDHDARAKQGNKPDFIVLHYDVPILYIEVKNIGVDLDKVEKSEQMARYYGYANLVLTDYVEFRFYRNGLRYVSPIIIANYNVKNRTITPIPENYEHLAKTLLDFTQSHKEPIRSGKHLSKIMGGKAQRIRDNVKQYLSDGSEKNAEIKRIYEAIKKQLVHGLTQDSFADMYAQTLVYGLFVARYHDETPNHFSRQEARDLVPASNPLLRHFFDHIVGPDFDKRLEYIVNELCLVFAHANVHNLMKQYFKEDLWGNTQKGPDPVIHFYEDFLKEYDAELRNKLGAFYTPQPVVQFIIRSVDYLLEKYFDLPAGLADTSKTANGIHRVQVLDPAVGTGTFISATIRSIYKKLLNSGQKGRWPAYVHHDLLPRLHGFELMMAPYTIAHLKLSMAFKETGFKYFNNRLGIYLTDSLEESIPLEGLFPTFGFAGSIAEESKEASVIKSKIPIMVVIGNPPYREKSINKNYKGHNVYKFEPTGEKLKEKNSKSLNDDYVKFIRFSENMVDRTGEGIVAMITAHGYLDNPTFRGMRHHLMKTFDDIYVIDLHGNANKKEKAPSGSDDKNIFDIKQGVAIFIGLKYKVKSTSKHGIIFRADCFGSRKTKFDYLTNNSFETIGWEKIIPTAPTYDWIVSNAEKKDLYEMGFSIQELFLLSGVGVVTARDFFVISDNPLDLIKNAERFIQSTAKTAAQLCQEVGLSNKKGWDALKARNALRVESNLEQFINRISYRPFDSKYIFYHPGLVWRTVDKIMKHFLLGDNLGFVSARSNKNPTVDHFYVSRLMTEVKLGESSTQSAVFPLYLYENDGSRVPNLKKEIVDAIERILGKVSPEDIFDYIYAVLHSPSYREKYKEFLKKDFPRVPYPQDKESFNKLVELGTELRLLHLLESSKVNIFITTYPIEGSDTIEKVIYKDGNVYINKDQYFGNVPESSWNFYIGGYRPALRWLKDRKGHTLTNENIEHFQKMIVALSETDRLMKEIDKIIG
jgi:predicted helicase